MTESKTDFWMILNEDEQTHQKTKIKMPISDLETECKKISKKYFFSLKKNEILVS